MYLLSLGTSPSSQGPHLPSHPWFWQLHAAKHQSRDCTCTRLQQDSARSTHHELYSLTHQRHQHCQSTSSWPATGPCITRHHAACASPSTQLDPAHPSSDTTKLLTQCRSFNTQPNSHQQLIHRTTTSTMQIMANLTELRKPSYPSASSSLSLAGEYCSGAETRDSAIDSPHTLTSCIS